MLIKLSKWLLVAVLCLSFGMHWALLQSVAWVGMTIQYSQDSTLKEALEKTFDGDHPCNLCKFVATGRSTEKKPDLHRIDIKFVFLCAARPTFLIPAQPSPLHADSTGIPPHRTDTPPTPPPRQILS